MTIHDERRSQVEAMVEASFGARISLSDKTHEIYQQVASNAPLIVIRAGEERRVVDNLAVIGHVLNKEVYDWSAAVGLYRCKPSSQLVAARVPEELVLSPQEKKDAGVTGLGLVAYYLREIWQHPLLGARPEVNPTYQFNRDDITEEQSKGSIFVFKDAHLSLNNSPMTLRMLKDLIEQVTWQQHNRPQGANRRRDRSLKGMSIVITAPLGWEIPAEIKDHAVDMIFPGPNADEFRSLMYGSILGPSASEDARNRVTEQEGRVLHAATGLKANSFIASLKISGVEQRLDRNNPYDIRDDIIAESKKQNIKAGGAISYEEPNWTMDDVGGHDALKSYLRDRSCFFDPENPIQDSLPAGVTLPLPKGILMVGVPGCGKSLEAKAMASMLRVPLLTLDMGAVFTGIVGGSEQRVREALQLAEECSPCVLRIEEIEKALSGSGSSNMSDGGTTNRVFQTVLNWLQEKEKPVFVVATANDVRQLPSELLRKGRFDEIFFVDLPVAAERVEIFRIHMRKWAGLTNEQIDTNFDLDALAARTNNFSGAEIEALIKDALYGAFAEYQRGEVEGEFVFQDRHIHGTIGVDDSRTFRILYDSEAEKLNGLREMARTSWANASTYESEALSGPGISSAAAELSTSDSIAEDFFADPEEVVPTRGRGRRRDSQV